MRLYQTLMEQQNTERSDRSFPHAEKVRAFHSLQVTLILFFFFKAGAQWRRGMKLGSCKGHFWIKKSESSETFFFFFGLCRPFLYILNDGDVCSPSCFLPTNGNNLVNKEKSLWVTNELVADLSKTGSCWHYQSKHRQMDLPWHLFMSELNKYRIRNG